MNSETSFSDLVSLDAVRALAGIAILFTALYSPAAVSKISGTVTDLSGNPIPHSTVIVENDTTHRSVSVQTDEHGRFAVRNLKGSGYSVFVVADSAKGGFRLRLDHAAAVHAHAHGRDKTAAQRRTSLSQVTAREH